MKKRKLLSADFLKVVQNSRRTVWLLANYKKRH
jgi:hypothetical protein